MTDKVSFLTFFLIWANRRRWEVPMLHVLIAVWLDTCLAPERLLMVFRGAAKSTIYAIWKAYCFYRDPTDIAVVWSADDKTAKKMTRDTINVLRYHPLCAGMLPRKPGAQSFWVTGSEDARNASMEALGVNSNATGSRLKKGDFDDIEVPKNIKTPDARANLRAKMDESVHIAVPGAQFTYIGTPHTHDSIYTEIEEGGAAVLRIPLFARHTRYTETSKATRYKIGFPIDEDGLYVLTGIHKFAKLLVEGRDYRIDGKDVVFDKPPCVGVMDFYTGCAWPERFTRDDIERRRKRTRTINGWDSQYQLAAKPVEEIRLDPAMIIPYDCEIEVRHVNNTVSLWLGQAKIEAVAMRWDPASGKLKSDVSAAGIVFQDETGRRYIHRVEQLLGEVAKFDEISGKKIVGGQVWQLCDMIEKFQIPRITIETNGIGGFAPAVLKAALKQRRLQCGVREEASVENKNKRMLEGLEPLLLSQGMLWAHVDVLDGPLWDQMKDWNPAVSNQEDDYVDVVAAACNDVPERVGKLVGNSTPGEMKDWRPSAGVHEVQTDY